MIWEVLAAAYQNSNFWPHFSSLLHLCCIIVIPCSFGETNLLLRWAAEEDGRNLKVRDRAATSISASVSLSKTDSEMCIPALSMFYPWHNVILITYANVLIVRRKRWRIGSEVILLTEVKILLALMVVELCCLDWSTLKRLQYLSYRVRFGHESSNSAYSRKAN